MGVPATSSLDTEDLRARVQKVLDAFLAQQAQVLGNVGPELSPLVDVAEDLLRGGKRLRAAFCYWAWRGVGGADCDEIVAAATALELFHAAALVHDDVMDDSDTRRGMPAAHRRAAGLHRASGWVGGSDHFGVASAILLGDLCLSWSDELLAGCGLPAERLRLARPVFDRMRTQLVGGQYLDMVEQVRGQSSVERARRVIRFKSAKYSVEHPLLLGATLAAGRPDQLDALSSYGLPLGEAFQLRDDVLGVFGDPGETGKPAGDDLREGKRTVLVAAALAQATPVQAGAIRRHLGDPHLDAAGVAALREVLVDTGALDRVETDIRRLTGEALAAVAQADVDPAARDVLRDLVAAATARST